MKCNLGDEPLYDISSIALLLQSTGLRLLCFGQGLTNVQYLCTCLSHTHSHDSMLNFSLTSIHSMKPAANLVTTNMSTTETEEMTKTPSSHESQCCPLSLHQKIIKTFNWILLVSCNYIKVFENHLKCRIFVFQFWHFLPIFVLLKLTCLVTLFHILKKWTFSGTFN